MNDINEVAIATKKKKANKTSKLDFKIPGKIFTDEGEKGHKSLKRGLLGEHSEKDYRI